MNAPAAIRASYVHYQRLKTTKMHQIIFEVPSELWPEAYKVLGEPNFEASAWWAIARLNGEAKQDDAEPTAKQKERTKFSRLRPSAQAALLCKKPTFWTFLSVSDENNAADYIRTICKVTSRSELDRDEEAAQDWFHLRDRYDAWMQVTA